MTAAAAAPATRQPVPWDPWCWLEVQIATATGTAGDPDRVGYWQPATPDSADPRYTVWQATGVAIPPAGTPPPAGWGEWVQGATGTKWGTDWNTISWRAVDCDLMSASFFTGSEPWDWNAAPGNGTLRLRDDDHTFFPAGPGSGYFDDIGVNTPIRVIANLTADFDQVPANAAKRRPFRVLITSLIRSIDHELTPAGQGTTTIHFSEPHVLYGRVNVDETSYTPPQGQNTLPQWLSWLGGLSDDPLNNLMRVPNVTLFNDPFSHATLTTFHAANDLWTEMCKVANSCAALVALRLYTTSYTPASYASEGNPRIFAQDPLYPDQVNALSGNNYGLDVRTLSVDCSPPDVTFNYTGGTSATGAPPYGDPTRTRVSLCPVGSIQFGHNDQYMANDVSIAAEGGTATELSDQASIDRYYWHTYQRHDFVHRISDTPLQAQRILDRMVDALFNISDCDFTIDEPRDFEFALGAAPLVQNFMDHPPVEPNRWIKLDWGWVQADLRVTKVAHQISPSGWTVTHSYEVHNPITHQEVR